MSLPAVRFRILLVAEFSEKYHVTPLSILGHCFNVVFSVKAPNPQLLHLTQGKMSSWKERDCNVYDKFNAPRMAAVLYALRGIEKAHE